MYLLKNKFLPLPSYQSSGSESRGCRIGLPEPAGSVTKMAIRISTADLRIRGSGSVINIYGPGTLLLTESFRCEGLF